MMARSNIDDAIKFGGVLIALLVSVLAISTVTINLDAAPQILEFLIVLMVILSIITAIGNFLKKI
ncbi:hypothetical protein KY332_01480 [Candidatus Woesearchaeota archaeon]|nr:hypothetical protein [Candidatus Woesearchaeota archaeon]